MSIRDKLKNAQSQQVEALKVDVNLGDDYDEDLDFLDEDGSGDSQDFAVSLSSIANVTQGTAQGVQASTGASSGSSGGSGSSSSTQGGTSSTSSGVPAISITEHNSEVEDSTPVNELNSDDTTSEEESPDVITGEVELQGELVTIPSKGTADTTTDDDDIVFDDFEGLDLDEFDDSSLLNPEVRAKEAADSIMTVLLHEGEVYQNARKHLYNSLPPSVFTDENYLIYRLYYEFRDRNFSLTDTFIENYYTYHLGDIENASSKIDIQAHGKIEDSYAKGYLAGVLKHYIELKEKQPASDETFFRNIENYRIFRKYGLASKALSNTYEILEEGLRAKGARKTLSGFDDAVSYFKREITTIESQFDDDDGAGYVSLYDAVLNPAQETQITKIGDFGTVNELNVALGGVYTGWLMVVAGPSKAGKTKFCTRQVYDAYIAGKNISVMPVEGGVQMFQAQLRAIHFHEFHRRNMDDPNSFNFPVSQQVIYQNDWDKLEMESGISLREMEMISARDLVENPAYGSIDLIDMNLHLDSFIDVIDGSVTSNKSDMVFIDYMQLITFNKGMTRQQALAEAFPKLLSYAKRRNIFILTPAQYNQESVKSMGKGEVGDSRTLIGDSYEIFKSSDVVLAMSGTVEDLKNGLVTFESVPSRLSRPFDKFQVYADFASCEFISINQEDGLSD